MTKIALFLELAERQKSDERLLSTYLSKIRRHATGLSAGIRDLIWTLDPKSDNLFQTLVRLREFGDSLFEPSGIEFHSENIDEKMASIPLPPTVRKHLLMIYKEAMNNCLKYSDASRCDFILEYKTTELNIIFRDNGQGFDLENIRQGYGLRNMRERAEKIGGHLSVESQLGKGTSIILKIKMPHMG